MTSTSSAYVRNVLGPREAVMDAILRSSLLEHRMPTIQVDDNAARVLQLLVSLRSPRHALEIGTLFGWSTIHIARGLGPGGRVTTLEVDPQAAALARQNIERAGMADRVEVVEASAAEYIPTLEPASVGFVFIDGDKLEYPLYLKLCFPLLEPDGLLVADDAFAGGDYAAEGDGEDGAACADAIRTYARAVGRSPLLESCFIGTDTGLLVSRRRGTS
jgi:caffeoyl-CoA O-methyltransferase